jgi:hypothetical protein
VTGVFTLKKGLGSLETSVTMYQSTRRNVPEDPNLHQQCRVNLGRHEKVTLCVNVNVRISAGKSTDTSAAMCVLQYKLTVHGERGQGASRSVILISSTPRTYLNLSLLIIFYFPYVYPPALLPNFLISQVLRFCA